MFGFSFEFVDIPKTDITIFMMQISQLIWPNFVDRRATKLETSPPWKHTTLKYHEKGGNSKKKRHALGAMCVITKRVRFRSLVHTGKPAYCETKLALFLLIGIPPHSTTDRSFDVQNFVNYVREWADFDLCLQSSFLLSNFI